MHWTPSHCSIDPKATKLSLQLHAEKCPNRKGVEEVLAHFCGGKIKTFDELLGDLPAGQIKAAWVSGGYPQPWHDDAAAEAFGSLNLLIVQDMFDSPLWRAATYQLPGAGFADSMIQRDGATAASVASSMASIAARLSSVLMFQVKATMSRQ